MLLRPMANLDMADLNIDVPADKGLILVSNHRSIVDILVGLAIFRRWGLMPRMFVKASIFSIPGIGLLLRLLRAIPASRETAREAIRAALNTLAQGGVIALAPEGRVPHAADRSDGVSELRSGVGRLAIEFGTPIIVVGITNTDAIWPLGSRFPRVRARKASRPKVMVEFVRLDVVQGASVTHVMAQLRSVLSQVVVLAESH